MTTLFNVFCPLITSFMKMSLLVMIVITILMSFLTLQNMFLSLNSKGMDFMSILLFPMSNNYVVIFMSSFSVLMLLNFISLVCYSYPVTTTLAFNSTLATMLWLISILLTFNKKNSLSSLLPLNSPSYLIPFLILVELVSIMVRPITLCFRLLANMSAGHIMLGLMCKLTSGLWVLGILFAGLELMVCLVQAFVFLMLISVYLEESLSH